jgi:O-antigen/teichoic acid export membrane protein
MYYFAFNAGVGISWNLMSSFFSALFPHLCAVRSNYEKLKSRYIASLKMVYVTVGTFILLQALLAPLYVPIIFGEKWIPAIPILMIICLSQLPEPLFWSGCILLNAIDKSLITLYLEMTFVSLYTISILIGVKWGILGVALAVFASQVLIIPIVFLLVRKYFRKDYVQL